MTEKRFTIVNMGLDGQYIKENGKIMTIESVVDLLNENEQLKHDATVLIQANQDYRKENEQLKKELGKFKEWEKHIGDVKREELDRVFKMSIYEIAEAFEYYRKRIKELEDD